MLLKEDNMVTRKGHHASVAKLLKSLGEAQSAIKKTHTLAKKMPKTGAKKTARRKRRRTTGGSYEIEGGKPRKKRSTKKKTGLKVTRTRKRRTTKKR